MYINHSLPSTHTLFQFKPIIISDVLQAPKISVMQLSATLGSAAGEALRHSLTFYPDTKYTQRRTEVEKSHTVAFRRLCEFVFFIKDNPEQ